MLCQELFCCCIEPQAVFWFDKSVTLIGEEHIFVFKALLLHCLNNLFRFGLFDTGIVSPLSNQNRDLYLVTLKSGERDLKNSSSVSGLPTLLCNIARRVVQ